MEVLIAPAKLTLWLRIKGVREDGYHLIEAEMVSLDLCDKLEVRVGDGLEICGAPEVGDLDAEENLATKALRLCGRQADVRLHKNIPAGAGLGGGSSDAGAILRMARFKDLSKAASIGADVPFCLVGGRARVGGIGEIVEPLPFEPLTVTLLIPPIRCPTSEVYAEWDRLGGPKGDNHNDLEPAALSLAPELKKYRDQLAEVAGKRPRLAGSGSAWWVEGSFPGGDRIVANAVPAGFSSMRQAGVGN